MTSKYSNIRGDKNTKFCVYKITNSITGKFYIGQTRGKLISRMRGHYHMAVNGSTFPLYNAIRKRGWSNFYIEIIEVCHSAEQLNEAERFWIFALKSRLKHIGYNISEGGNSGHPFSRELIKTLTNSRRGVPLSPEHRKKIGDACRGHRHTDDTKRRISENQRDFVKVDKNKLINSIIKHSSLYDVANDFSLTRDTIILKIRSVLKLKGFRDARWELFYKPTLLLSIKQGLSCNDINKALGFSAAGALKKQLLALGFSSLKEARKRLCPTFSLKLSQEQVEELKYKFYELGVDINDLTQEYKLSRPTVRKFLKEETNNVRLAMRSVSSRANRKTP